MKKIKWPWKADTGRPAYRQCPYAHVSSIHIGLVADETEKDHPGQRDVLHDAAMKVGADAVGYCLPPASFLLYRMHFNSWCYGKRLQFQAETWSLSIEHLRPQQPV